MATRMEVRTVGNVVSYLRWRGDLPFEQYPFNEADNLVLSALAYINLTGIVSAEQDTSVSISDASNLFFEMHSEAEIEKMKHGFLPPPSLLKELAATKRFGNALLSHYVDITDDTTQFAAVTITLDDGTAFVAYRGTDTTIIGWREDFQMSFMTIPAQKMAVDYLNVTATDRAIRVGGHSKGGNLAVYASVMCDEAVKEQIISVYDNDGPGFSCEVMTSAQYQSIQGKIFRFIPEFSVIGMLFEHEPPTKIVESSTDGLLQHDPMTWQIECDSFITKTELTPRCRFLNQIFDTWLESADNEQRQSFTKDFFDALGQGGRKQIAQVANDGINGFESVVVALINSDEKTRSGIRQFFGSVADNFKKIDYLDVLKQKAAIRGVLFALFGLLFVAIPEIVMSFIGTNIFLAVLLFAGYKLVRYYLSWRKNEPVKRHRAIIFGVIAAISIVFLAWNQVLTVSVNLVLSGFLLTNAYFAFANAVKGIKRGNQQWWMGITNAVISLLFGIVALATVNDLGIRYIMPLGSYLFIIGIGNISTAIYNDIKAKKEDFYL